MNIELAKVLLQRYPAVRGYIQGSIYGVLPESDIRKRPAKMNSIVWNIWHMARTEDVGINRLVTDGQQVFDQSNWMQKLNINFRHFGTGMSKEEVDSLSEEINIEALKNYHDAVEEQTMKVFAQLSEIDLEDEPDEYYLYISLIIVIGRGALGLSTTATQYPSWSLRLEQTLIIAFSTMVIASCG